MENFSYHVPVYVVTGGVDLAGHSSELTAGQVGIFDRSTFSVATSSGSGKEFFFAQGAIGGKDWYGNPVTESHKSPFFLGAEVENIYLSTPQRIQNEEWVIGFNGSTSSKSLSFEEGKAVRVKLFFHGNPAYRFFGGPKEYVVSYTPPADCTEPCDGVDCPDPIVDCLVHTQKLVDAINDHVELHKFGVQAKLVNAPFVAGTPNMTKYCLSLCDNGDSVALQAVQAQAPVGSRVVRTSRVGSTSTYEFCQADAAAAPADFAQSGSILLAVCGSCPAGSTESAAKDVYLVRRPLAGTEDLTTDAARDTYADTVGTAYGSAVDADKTFLGQDGAVALVQFKVAAGTEINALLADTVELSHTEAASCIFADPADVAWTECGVGISSSRTMRINSLNRPDCAVDGDRIADLEAILAGVEGIKLETLTKIAGVACVDDYTVEQDSVDCLPEDCLTNNVTFTYDELPSFENQSWELVPVANTDNAERRCGIRITAGYIDPQFGDCTFHPGDYYENDPIKFEVSLLQEDGSNCDFASLPTVHQARAGQIARQSGQWVAREVIMKTDAYQKHIDQFSTNPRMREAFDMNLLSMVDRSAFYNLYYVTYRASYGNSFRKKEIQEKFTTIFAFKEGDASAKVFEANVIGVLSGKSGVPMHVIEGNPVAPDFAFATGLTTTTTSSTTTTTTTP